MEKERTQLLNMETLINKEGERMTPEQFKEKMIELKNSNESTDIIHEQADELIIELIKTLGYTDGAKIYESLTKWYM